jgi:homopolymeric O-antigen transport system permease protein
MRAMPAASRRFGTLGQAIQDVVSRRRLIRYLVQAEMKKRGSDTLLGNLWWILDPLLQMVVYVVFVTIIANRNQADYPLFIFAAILPFKWYTAVVTDSASAVVTRSHLIRQIAFPKIVLPVATATAEVVGFAWGLIPLFGIMLFYSDRISLFLLWLPVIAVVQYVFSVATAIFVSAANVFFRDLGNIIGHLLRLWWFLSPGLYSLDSMSSVAIFKEHPSIIGIAKLNPFAVLFEAYRSVIYGTADGHGAPHAPDLGSLAALFLVSLGLVALAAIFFKRVEPNFAKVL